MRVLNCCHDVLRSVARVIAFAAAMIVAVVVLGYLGGITGASGDTMTALGGGVLFLLFYLFFLRGDNFNPAGEGGD